MPSTVSVPAAWVESISDFRLPQQTDCRLQTLMNRNSQGLLQPPEKDELVALAALSEEISFLRAQAMHHLGEC
jgi:hypothetical protein